MFWQIALLAAAVPTLAYEKLTIYNENSFQVYGCGLFLQTQATFCTNSTAYYGDDCYCNNTNSLASLTGCFEALGKNNDATYAFVSEYCMTDQNITVTSDDLHAAFAHYQANATDPSGIPGFNVTKLVHVPIKVNATAARVFYDAENTFLGNFNRSLYYGSACLAFWGLVFVVAMVANWLVRLFPGLRTSVVGNSRVAKIWRKYVTLPALMTRKKNDHQPASLFSYLVPSRMESLIVFAFFWFLLGCCTGQLHYVPGQTTMPKKSYLLRLLADRMGIITTVLFPLFILLGGRNNFLQWLTGWKFSTFITYHRWIARLCVLMIFLHGVFYTVVFVHGGYYAESVKEKYFVFGILAMVAGALICFQGLLLLRRWWYEIFLVVHIILAVLWTVGAYYHLEEFGYLPFVFAAIAVWAFDRAVRLGRILVFGFPKATVSLVADETLRVVVPKPAHWKSIPGGHSWLFFGKSWFFWQSHPFTFVETADNGRSIVFLCKMKTGVTKKVGNLLANYPGKTSTMWVAVEGPYGESCPVQNHSSAVFIAGGNGIPGIYSEICDLAERSKDNTRQMLKLYWIIRETKSVAWMFRELEHLRTTKIHTTIYITRPDTSGLEHLSSLLHTQPAIGGLEPSLSDEGGEKDEDKTEDLEKKSENHHTLVHEFDELVSALQEHFPHITIKTGRPLIGDIVDAEIEECDKSAAFISCGHPVMVDDLRHVVVSRIDSTDKRIDFFEQLQVWA